MVVEELNMRLRPIGDFFCGRVFPEGPVVVQLTKPAKLTKVGKSVVAKQVTHLFLLAQN